MKKNLVKIVSLFTLCTCLGMTGCAKQRVEVISVEQSIEAVRVSEVSDSEKSEQFEQIKQAEQEKQVGVYADVLAEYADMVQNNFYTEMLENEDMDKYDACFGEHIGFEIRTRVRNVYYALYDIDSNGVDELMIAASETDITENDKCPWYYDMFTFDGTNVVQVFNDFSFGYRTNYKLMENGIIRVDYSASAAESGTEFYRIGEDGLTPELVDSFSTVGAKVDDVITFTYTCNNEEVTEQDYDARIENYGNEITASLEWIQVK